MISTRGVSLVFAAALFALVGTACAGQQSTASIALSEFTIKPKGVQAVAGVPMMLTLVNSGKIEHNLEVDARISDQTTLAVLKPGESKRVTFTPKIAGTFPFACTIPGHAPAGMVGTLTINP